MKVRTGETLLISKEPLTGKGPGGVHPSISEDGSRVKSTLKHISFTAS